MKTFLTVASLTRVYISLNLFTPIILILTCSLTNVRRDKGTVSLIAAGFGPRSDYVWGKPDFSAYGWEGG